MKDLFNENHTKVSFPEIEEIPYEANNEAMLERF